MKAAGEYAVVLVTAPDLKSARKLARAALEGRAAACVNLVPGVESHYWWQGKLERSGEVLLVFKTRRSRLAQLEKVVVAEHPYETPEFVALPLAGGNEKYLEWVGGSVRRGA